MNGTDILKAALEARETSKTTLAEMLGYKRPSSITNALTGGRNILLCNFCKMLGALGYEVVVRDKNNPKKEWKVDAE